MFASFLDNNGEIDLGIILDYEKTDSDVFYKLLLIEEKLVRKRKLDISYEERYQSELITKTETTDGIIFQIYTLRAQFINQIYNEQISVGKTNKVNKERSLLLILDHFRTKG